MTRRRTPRIAAGAVRAARERTAPATLLAAVQGAWHEAVGAAIAERAEPVSERDGVVTVACASAVWAQELDLLQTEILGRLNAALGPPSAAAAGPAVRGLRTIADLSRFNP